MRVNNLALLSLVTTGGIGLLLSSATSAFTSRKVTTSTRKSVVITTPGAAFRTEASKGGDRFGGIDAIIRQSQRTQQKSITSRKAKEDDDDDDEEEDAEDPLAKGVDSVSWLPSVFGNKSTITVSGVKDGNEILPLFPLGGIVYTPNSEHVLNIFEPRYRQMYNDILMNGTKRFVVSMSHPTERGRFAEVGVLFELEDLKEVSEQTADQIKYICNHRVTGRVKINRILNPVVWETRETYLKVEGTVIDDTGKLDESAPSNDVYAAVVTASQRAPKEENWLRDSFADLVNLQHELEEDVRFTRATVNSLAVGPGSGQDGLWQTIQLWQNYAEQRLIARQNDLQKEFQEKLIEFLKKEKGFKDEELPSAIGFNDLSPALQQEVQELQKRMAVELQPLVLESTLTMQKILEAKDHKARCNLLRYFIDAERKRLEAKKTIQGMFTGGTSASKPGLMNPLKSEPVEGEEKKKKKQGKEGNVAPKPRSIFMDEPDAFQ